MDDLKEEVPLFKEPEAKEEKRNSKKTNKKTSKDINTVKKCLTSCRLGQGGIQRGNLLERICLDCKRIVETRL